MVWKQTAGLGMAGLALCSLLLMAALSVGQSSAHVQEVSFISSRNDKLGLYLFDVDHQLFTPYIKRGNISALAQMAWSPDGQHIIYRAVFNFTIDLFMMDANGSNRRPITQDGHNNHAPSWSPDGKRVAYSSDLDGEAEIAVIDIACSPDPVPCGVNRQQLTTNAVVDDAPAWSPDGRWIAFHSFRDRDYEIYVMDADGSNQRRLTNSPGRDLYPTWSPDSQQLAFISERDNNFELYVIDVGCLSKGTVCTDKERRLTSSDIHELTPQWSPDSSQILFSVGEFESFLLDVQSGVTQRLTSSNYFLRGATWREAGG